MSSALPVLALSSGPRYAIFQPFGSITSTSPARVSCSDSLTRCVSSMSTGMLEPLSFAATASRSSCVLIIRNSTPRAGIAGLGLLQRGKRVAGRRRRTRRRASSARRLGVRKVIKVVILACLVEQREVIDVIDRSSCPGRRRPSAAAATAALHRTELILNSPGWKGRKLAPALRC